MTGPGPAAVLAARTSAQLLGTHRAATVAEVVERLGALQAQDLAATALAVRARSTGLTAADFTPSGAAPAVDAPAGAAQSGLARAGPAETGPAEGGAAGTGAAGTGPAESGPAGTGPVEAGAARGGGGDAGGERYVRTWLMRGTLHLLAASDAGWMLGLLGPLNRARGARRRAQLGLDDALCERAVRALPEVLADGPLDRAAVVARLASLGVVLGADRQAAPHLLAYAASRGVLGLGPEVARGKPTYRALPAYPHVEPDAAAAMLARRYLAGHQPAGWADFAAWSGLGARESRAAFDALDDELATDGELRTLRGWTPAPPDGPSVRLVGHFDPYLLGYADRTAVVPAEFVARVRTGGGFVTPTVLVRGAAVATWRRTGTTVTIEPFHPLPDAVVAGIRREVDDLARFVGTPLTTSE